MAYKEKVLMLINLYSLRSKHVLDFYSMSGFALGALPMNYFNPQQLFKVVLILTTAL